MHLRSRPYLRLGNGIHIVDIGDWCHSTHSVHTALSLQSDDLAYEIFRKFVEKERNSVFKGYEIGISEGSAPVVVSFDDPTTGGLSSYELDPIGENIYCPMTEGFYEGEDGRTLIELAIDLWEKQLAEVDRVTNNS